MKPRRRRGTAMVVHPPDELVEAVLEGHCVAFVSAGFSAAVVPTWTRLLENVATRDGVGESARAQVLELITTGGPLSLEAAAQLLLGELGSERFSEALAGLLESPVSSDLQRRRLELLQGIPFRGSNCERLLAEMRRLDLRPPSSCSPRGISPRTTSARPSRRVRSPTAIAGRRSFASCATSSITASAPAESARADAAPDYEPPA